ncbi:hypothetical protein SADUNF_Sadunf12G0075000 [Salix dunnii]|uniref:Uncharacterized protein n=1 Tax=Salix dunnii TaxID=1413687 RepID=A0A835JI83_9ROSI|nr:hypothetical protein SADUNF_Sadunf12G0075000 [Salix dunnii]
MHIDDLVKEVNLNANEGIDYLIANLVHRKYDSHLIKTSQKAREKYDKKKYDSDMKSCPSIIQSTHSGHGKRRSSLCTRQFLQSTI